VDEKLHKDVEDICFITKLLRNMYLHVPDGIKIERVCGEHNGEPGHHRVHLKT